MKPQVGQPTITLTQWNEATTEQRSQWLNEGVLLRPEDADALYDQYLDWLHRAKPSDA